MSNTGVDTDAANYAAQVTPRPVTYEKMKKRIPHIEWPPVALTHLKSISEGWFQYAKMDDDKNISLHGLSSQQGVALTLFYLIAEADEVFDNLNLVIGDMEHLRDDERVFGDQNPFLRYKLLMRTYLYEFARFEDLFGYFTLWCEKKKLITKKDRKELRQDFYEQHESVIKIRNTLAHDAADWGRHCTSDIVLLQGAELFGLEIRDNEGNKLTWQQHLSPLCENMINAFYEAGNGMLEFWNTLVRITVIFLQKEGHFES